MAMLSKLLPWYRRRWFDNRLAEVELNKMLYRTFYDNEIRQYADEGDFAPLVVNPISSQEG